VFLRASERIVRCDADDAGRSIGMEIANLEIRHEPSSRFFENQIGNDPNVALRGFMCGQIRANMMEVTRPAAPRIQFI
jgi:hypothetical protein